ncbi:MAG: cob(I)yrinic acid a,c-diamide adenosyltransferase [Mediterranea massiliensis]|nr:cob(I)yrinic acid a,c-diamide adenosyltransferase [Mediterranea massiliensis]
MKIYTRTGDKGKTSLIGGKRVSKTHQRLEAYGTIDELNAHIGLLLAQLPADESERATLLQVQNILFVVGAQLATPPEVTGTLAVSAEMLSTLEEAIDRIEAALPSLKAFVLPGGTQAASQCHVCRTVCRRAERRVLALASRATIPSELTSYLNRLSDYLFVLSRKINNEQGMQEIFWQNPC